MVWCAGSLLELASRAVRSFRLIGLSCRKISESRLMVTTIRDSVISFTVLVFGTATSMPDCSTGAVSMKITSSTSTTSTSGVMLISASDVCVCPVLLVKATCGLPLDWLLARLERDLFHAVEQLAGEVVHARRKVAAARRELVVGHHRGHSDNEPGSSGNKSLRDAGRDSPQCCRSRLA